MKMSQIIEKINNAISETVKEACRSSGYWEASFPIKLTQLQAEEISDFLNNEFDIKCRDEIKIDPKAVYRLWVSYEAETDHGEGHWGLKRVTESPDRR